MIVPGQFLIPRKIITGALSPALQSQPCGVDLTLKRVLTWVSHGTIDFDNSQRQTAGTTEMAFKNAHDLVKGQNPNPDANPTPSGNPRTSIPSTTTNDQKPSPGGSSSSSSIHLAPGSYLVEFNEAVAVPLDAMGQLFVRSSLFRSGALVTAGVVDSGYAGGLGALLQVVNPCGLRLYRDARLAQLVLHSLAEPVDGYRGVYQGRTSL